MGLFSAADFRCLDLKQPCVKEMQVLCRLIYEFEDLNQRPIHCREVYYIMRQDFTALGVIIVT